MFAGGQKCPKANAVVEKRSNEPITSWESLLGPTEMHESLEASAGTSSVKGEPYDDRAEFRT